MKFAIKVFLPDSTVSPGSDRHQVELLLCPKPYFTKKPSDENILCVLFSPTLCIFVYLVV